MKITNALVLGSVLLSATAMADLSYNCSNRGDNFILTVQNDRTLSYSNEQRGFTYEGTLSLTNGPMPGHGRGPQDNNLTYSGIIFAQADRGPHDGPGHNRPGNQTRMTLEVSRDLLRGTPRGTAVENGRDVYTCGMLMKGPTGPMGPGSGHNGPGRR